MVRGANTYRIISDQLGSPRVVVNVNNLTDIPYRANYSEWGVQTMITGTSDYIPFGFAGGLYDKDTGLVRFGLRDYDPFTGRWTSKDPILFAGGQGNLYVYVGNDPVNFRDPTGRKASSAAEFFGTQAAAPYWNLANAATGIALGVAGWIGGTTYVGFANGALEFRGNSLVGTFGASATTFGNVIVYASPNPSVANQAHERQHVIQSYFLGPSYLSTHLLNQSLEIFGVAHESTPLECGPSDKSSPRPF